MGTRNTLAVEALIVLNVLMLFSQAYCYEVDPLPKGDDGQSYYSPSVSPSRPLSCFPVSNIPDDPPQGQFPTLGFSPSLMKGDTGVSGTTIASPSPSPAA